MTLRGIETLKRLRVLFCEDTREMAKLLEILGVGARDKEFHSYAAHNMKAATDRAVRFLREGVDVGLVSDRGMPVVSDPGALLVARAHQEGFSVVPVPGPSSPTTLLPVSGLPADRFLFLGFPPDKASERERLWAGAQALGVTVCFFESPRRIRRTLEELKARFPGGRVFLGREMTKLHESFQGAALAELDPGTVPELGEFTVALEPGRAPKAEGGGWREEARLRAAPDKEWAKAMAERFGISAKEAYDFLQKLKK